MLPFPDFRDFRKAMTKPANRVYEFGPFRLESAERLLLRDNATIPLTPKTFETLLLLLQNSGSVVTKDDLMKQLWPDTVVEEANLARHVWMLRKALGNGVSESGWIETVPKLGYRFVASVTVIADADRTGVFPEAVQHVREHERGAPTAAAPSTSTGMIVGAAALVLALAGWRLWPGVAPTTPAVGSRLTVLTDGIRDDVAPYWSSEGKIYFSRLITADRAETWTMDADGAAQRRANTEIPHLLSGRWSPDGSKVVFTKDNARDVSFLANADGTDERRLAAALGNMDWSPDSARFVYQKRTSSESSEIFLYTVASGESISLTPGIASADPSFSYDGRRIAFTSWRDGNPEIYVMNADGSSVRRVTNHPAFDNYPVFSPDGTKLAFQSNRMDEHVEIYLQALDVDLPPVRLTHSSGVTGLFPKCWSPDGTRLLVYSNRNGRYQIGVMDADAVPAALVAGEARTDLGFPRLSRDGRLLLHEARLTDRRLQIRVLHRSTGASTTILETAPGYSHQFHLDPAWSPDPARVVFADLSDGNTEIFSITLDGTGRRNLTNNPLRDVGPAFSPETNAMFFTRDAFGEAKLYRLDVDGRQERVTDQKGHEISPAVSPDGSRLAYAADRSSVGLDIYVRELKNAESERRLTSLKFHDSAPAFSPDGRTIAFIATSDGNAEIYLVNADGTGLVRMTHTPAEEATPSFAAEGTRILFSSNRSGRFAIYEMPIR
jgi:Tol biopolymer transport system component/DNA-binding winged helix-turn-helix (wHTH) protein